MEEQTVVLLKECNAGCKMAINSMERLKEYVKNASLNELLEEYKKQHRELEEESARLLEESGETQKQPDLMASAFSWLTTELKMMVQDDSTQIAKILMNGCNMGIQSVSECMNKCPKASHAGMSVAKKLVKCEEKLMEDVKKFL
ncbi:MAG: hypothetical protein HFG88_02840 [Dorea sp.]|jgi:hypothetical protein|nr:hypothetical protein [Dorea sp.]